MIEDVSVSCLCLCACVSRGCVGLVSLPSGVLFWLVLRGCVGLVSQSVSQSVTWGCSFGLSM